MVSVEIQGIRKGYEKNAAVLADVSLTVAPGELFFLLGPSGCGKSTLLRLLAGFLQPEAGTIRIGGQDVTAQAAEQRGTAMVFQSYALWPHLTVAENVAFGLDVRHVGREEKAQRVQEALATVDLADLAARKPPALSGGQQQRVALARALVVRPRVLLLDEPLSNLDAKLRLAMRSELRRLCKQGGFTTIYVTHDQKEALSMADRLAVLHQGRLLQVGTPREVYQAPASRFVADFIGESNFFPARIAAVNGETVQVESALGSMQARPRAAGLTVGREVLLCVRPEAIRLDAPEAAPNSFAARLNELTYLGEIGQLSLEVAGQSLKAFELHPRPRGSGDTLRCQLAPEDLILIPAQA